MTDVTCKGNNITLKDGQNFGQLEMQCRSEEHCSEWITAFSQVKCKSSPPAPAIKLNDIKFVDDGENINDEEPLKMDLSF